MKAFLMYTDRDFNPQMEIPPQKSPYKDRDFELQRKLSPKEQALIQDLELNTLFNAMALGDDFLLDVARRTLLSSLTEPDAIRYRQDVLRDCLKHASIIRGIYDIAIEAIEREKKNFWGFSTRYPGTTLHRAVDVLQMFVGMLKRLREVADEHTEKFQSDGFVRFFTMIKGELGNEYFARIEEHLKELKFREGILISTELGQGNKGSNYVLRKSQDNKQSWMKRIFEKKPPAYTFNLHPRDESGAKALSEMADRGLNLVANALAQSTDHILSFFQMLRTELAFYVGCLNLHGQLAQKGEPTCFPLPATPGESKYSFQGLYDVCLSLSVKERVVGNDGNADKMDLVIITGANQGGKSTFLRSVGLAQSMMQAGMFVPAESFCSEVCDGLFTHYKREEDTTMKSGKLDEELGRMSDIVDNIKPNSMMLFNESFAATNEREGSEIARQITGALVEKGIRVFFVTHLYEFARGFYKKKMENAVFLRAERRTDGERTFRLVEGEPLQTSFGEDLYDRIFRPVQSGIGCQESDLSGLYPAEHGILFRSMEGKERL